MSTSTFELTEDQRLVQKTVREFVDRDVMPVASAMEHRDEYPEALVETMKSMGLFGLNIPDAYGGSDIDYTTFAIVFEELSRNRCPIRRRRRGCSGRTIPCFSSITRRSRLCSRSCREAGWASPAFWAPTW